MSSRRYSAFISYRHADNTQEGRRWAEWLHRALERYVVPPDLIGTDNLRFEPIRDSLYPIFRDEDELPANADLATGIRLALDASDHLIVLCSPRSAVSPWVRKEVREFKELGRSDRILAVIIAGEPNADDPAKAREGIMLDEECFCEELRFGAVGADGTLDWSLRTEPLAANLRPIGTRAEGFVTAEAYREYLTLNSSLAPEKIAARTEDYRRQLDRVLLKVVAGLLGVPLGQLVDRDAAYRTALAEKEAADQREIADRERRSAERLRHRNRILTVASVAILVLAIVAGRFWRKAEAETIRAEEQTGLAVERSVALKEASRKQTELLHEASMADYSTALQRIEKDGNWPEGVAHLVRALKWEPENSLAAMRLYSTLSFYAFEKQTWPRAILPRGIAQFSPDGTRIVIASYDGTARVWDMITGQTVGEPLRHKNVLHSAQFSRDGTRIVTASDDKTAGVWDAATGQPVCEPLHHEDEVWDAQFSPDGTLILTASGRTVRVWDSATGRPVGKPFSQEDYLNGAQFSPDGTRIVTASDDETARVWDASTGQPVGKPLRHAGEVNSAQFSPDGTQIVTACYEGTARVWNAISGKAIGEPLRHEGNVIGAQFSPDGSRIVTASDDETARVWDAVTGKALCEPLRHESSLNSAQFSSDGTYIITASGKTVRIWDAATGQLVVEPLRHEGSVKDAEFSPDGSQVLTLSGVGIQMELHTGLGTAKVWEAFTGNSVGEPLRHEDSVWDAQFSRDGNRIITASSDKTARVWNLSTGKPVGEPLRHENNVNSAQFSPDGTRIVTASGLWGEPGKAHIWDVATGQIVGDPLPHEDAVWDAQFSPDGTRIVTASHDKTAKVWNTSTGNSVGEPMRHENNVNSAKFSPDGTRIVTASDDTTAQVWDAVTGKKLGEPLRHEDAVSSAEFSPDGSRILTACSNPLGGLVIEPRAAQVWDAVTGIAMGEPLRHDLAVSSAHFNHDGSRIVTASYDKTARVWDAFTGNALGEPLRHNLAVSSAQFNPDGTRIVTASKDGAARVWDSSNLTQLPVPVPQWILTRARAIAGMEFDENGELQVIPVEQYFDIPLKPEIGHDAWANLARWMMLPPHERTLTPDSRFTRLQIAERERDSGTWEGLYSALLYDPTVPLARLFLARFEENPKRAAFLRSYDLARLPDDASLWTRAAASLIEQQEFPLAHQAADRALSLDPNNEEAKKARAAVEAIQMNGEKE